MRAKSADAGLSYVFDLYEQTRIDMLPDDWENHLLELLLDLHETSMPDEMKINALVSAGEVIHCGRLYGGARYK